jgi:hypothetical protein
VLQTKKQFLGEFTAEEHITLYGTAEESQKLCFYARLKAQLPYINYSYMPEWNEVYVPYPMKEPFAFGMYCATLPTIYIIRKERIYEEIQITYLLQSSIDRYNFNTETIVIADSAVLRKFQGSIEENLHSTRRSVIE